jgi:LysM repeat protein
MTRENKIGRLVGLAFIIAVGILLSDHLSTDNEPTPAPLQLAGSAVRSSLGDASSADGDLLASTVVRVPPSVSPTAPVPTSAELAARARRAAVATAAPVPPVVTETDPIPPTALAAVPMNLAPVPPGSNPDLLAAARRAGETLVAPTNGTAPALTPKHATARTIEAESGDSLGDLAERAYGTDTKATRDALLAANPGLRSNPNLIVAGRSYAVAAATSATTPLSPTAHPSPTAKSTPVAAVMYTVQPGDTLWSIAADEVGTPQAVAAIRDLNRDVLHGDHLRVHMKLRLPKSKAE